MRKHLPFIFALLLFFSFNHILFAQLGAVFEDGFEDYPDFATTFDPWTLVDYDYSPTYDFYGIDFPGCGTAFAFMIFNPSQTVPPLVDLRAYEGDKMAACFAAIYPPNSDWLIAPYVQLGLYSSVRFFARSHTDSYGLERFKVAVSTAPYPTHVAGFVPISGDDYIEAPANWTEYHFDLRDFDVEQVHIAIYCVSDDAFAFYVDNFTVFTGPDVPPSTEDEVIPGAVTELSGNYPNPFNPETTISYSLREAGNVSIDIYNTKGQLVKHLLKDDMPAGDHRVVWNGTDNNKRAVSSGVYYYKMNSGRYSSTKKMIMMK